MRRLKALLFIVAVALALVPMKGVRAATPGRFKLERGTVRLEVPEGWQDVSGLYGIPLMLVGPEKGGGRPVLSVTATGMGLGPLADEATLERTQGDYREGRSRWLKKMGGTALEFANYRKLAWRGVASAHAVGYRYDLKGVEYVEASYFVDCKGKLYHLKTLLRAAQEKEMGPSLEAAAASFTCE